MAKRKISKKEELAYPVLEEITGGAKNGYETKSGDWYQMYSTYSGAFGYRRVWARLIKPYQLNYRDFAKFLQAMPEYKEVFEDYHGVLTPSSAGVAPKGLKSTGSPEFCTVWTYMGLPSISLPLLVGENNLPLGVQLIGDKLDDLRFLGVANWLEKNCKKYAK